MRHKRVWGLFAGLIALAGLGSEAHAIIGRPLTPFSYAGVARRTARRSVAYGAYGYGAAYAAPVAAGAAMGAAAAVSAMPPGCAPGYPCGGVVYEPAYSGTSVVYVPQY
jgi:hypothetical protein